MRILNIKYVVINSQNTYGCDFKVLFARSILLFSVNCFQIVVLLTSSEILIDTLVMLPLEQANLTFCDPLAPFGCSFESFLSLASLRI